VSGRRSPRGDFIKINNFVKLNFKNIFLKMSTPNNGYLDQDGGITIEIEWHYSHLLHQPEYSHLDDIIRKQKLQML